ncbi:S9 family peptidase [Sinomicrobium kalidii]|uniref:S9 family peptidase n=1 Tax=Sinomicrobium kalidii TaxID=2900738 RepID=UPI001E5CC825|nr:S9 family peptidase [Sinomicrobium kalidii]UGU17657.1 S9 family peptidase [Sinomicrobium kalidii]
MRPVKKILLIVSGLLSTISGAQEVKLNIENITNGSFIAKKADYSSWTNENRYVHLDNETGRLVGYVAGTKEQKILVSVAGLIGKNKKGKIRNYTFSEDGSAVIVSLNTEGKTRIFLVDLTGNTNTELLLDKTLGIPRNLKLSPDNKMVSFVCKSDIYAYDVRNKKTIRLTTDGSDEIINSNASFRFASILSSRDHYWSPDSKYVAFNQFDTKEVPTYKIINNTDSLYPFVKEFQYIKPGKTLPAVKPGIVEVATQKVTWPDIGEDYRNSYITNLKWNPKSNKLYIQKLNRNQNVMDIFVAEAGSRNTEKIYTEQEDTFLDAFDLVWLNGGSDFLWMSENDGWRHLYKITSDGKQKTCITPGEFDVFNKTQVRAAPKSKWVYFHASPENSLHLYLFRASLDGKGKIERITPEKETGTHKYDISPDGKWAFQNFSRFDIPTRTRLVKLPAHKVVKTMEDNAALSSKIEAIHPSPVTYSEIQIEDDVALDSWMIKPPNFDASKKYPVVFHVYSMPANQTTADLWKGRNYFFYQFLAKNGFIVMGIDGRGTPVLKGKKWRKSIYLKHGILPADDIAKATKAMAAQHPYINAEKIGAYGWSGGGLMSLLLVLRHPDVFNTAIPGAYLSHHKYYHAGFTERYMGTPQQNPEAYEETAALNYVKNLKGNLLLVHGTGDDNVHYQNTEALINKLTEEKKVFSVVPYPNRTHRIRSVKGSQYHLFKTYLNFFSQHLLGE